MGCAAGLLMLIAGRQVSVARAFVAGPTAAARGLDAGRKSNVALRAWTTSKRNYKTDMEGKTDEELHELITLCRQKIMDFRFEKFRKTRPSQFKLYEWKYKMAVAKTLLYERRPDKEEEAPEKTLTEAMATDDIPGEPTWTRKGADWNFWARHQVGNKLRNRVPKNWGWIQQYRKTD